MASFWKHSTKSILVRGVVPACTVSHKTECQGKEMLPLSGKARLVGLSMKAGWSSRAGEALTELWGGG